MRGLAAPHRICRVAKSRGLRPLNPHRRGASRYARPPCGGGLATPVHAQRLGALIQVQPGLGKPWRDSRGWVALQIVYLRGQVAELRNVLTWIAKRPTEDKGIIQAAIHVLNKQEEP